MKINFIPIKPKGFWFSEGFCPTLLIRVLREGYARKHWQVVDGKKELVCFSSNGIQSRTQTLCQTCADQKLCHLKLRLYFKHNHIDSCLELPLTSFQNYRIYKQRILQLGLDVKKITTRALVKNKGYWGEVLFSRSDREKN